MLRQIHPAVLVTAGCFFIYLLQIFPTSVAMVCTGCMVLLAACLCFQRWWRIVRRLRFIFLALLVLFAWQTPGRLVWPAMGEFSPTFDGTWLALIQGIRLLGVASVVALLMHILSPAAWVTGLYGLSMPLRFLGFPSERFAVRMHLVLEGVERQTTKDWQALLRNELKNEQIDGTEDAAGTGFISEVSLPQPLRVMDYVCLSVLLILAVLGWFLCKG